MAAKTGRELIAKRDPVVLRKLETMGARMRPLLNQQFSDDMGRTIQIVRMMRPLQDLTADKLEFVVPLTVIYQGTGTPEEWEGIETRVETAVAQAVNPQIQSRLIRRTKVDPYKGDPRSMTLLRYQKA